MVDEEEDIEELWNRRSALVLRVVSFGLMPEKEARALVENPWSFLGLLHGAACGLTAGLIVSYLIFR